MNGIVDEIMALYDNFDTDREQRLDNLLQEVYNLGVTEGYNKRMREEFRESRFD